MKERVRLMVTKNDPDNYLTVGKVQAKLAEGRERRARVRLIDDVNYWMLFGSEVVFTAPKNFHPLNAACIQIDESVFNYIKQGGGRVLRLITGPNPEPGSWWLA